LTDSALNQFVTRGTNATRVATTPSPPTSASGYIFYETDTGNTYAWTGAAWAQINSGGTLTQISDQSPTGTGVVSFTSLGSYNHLILMGLGASTVVATSTNIKLQFNSDTSTSNYVDNYLLANNTSPSSAGHTSNGYIILSDIAGSTAPAGTGTAFDMIIPFYRNASFHKSALSRAFIRTGTGVGNLFNEQWQGMWLSASAITRLDLTLVSGNWAAGSHLILYGLT
jgi:hypothetical protein